MFLGLLTLISALLISGVSAYYSITGLTAIFPAAVIPVIIMAVVLEIGKISAVIFLHNHWKTAPFLIKSYLIVAIFILMLINSLGIFGLLSKAHIEQEVLNTNQSSQTELIVSKLDNENSVISDLNKQISQIDNALQKLTDTGRASTALAQATAQRKQRESLVEAKNQHIQAVETLTSQKLDADAKNKKLSADFGPLSYIADAVYGNPTAAQLENVVRWIISILVLVMDPLAIALLISSQFSLSNRKKHLTNVSEISMLELDDSILNKKEK